MKIHLNNWMADISDSTNLFSLSIPGTHDCVTQYVQLPYISRCQDLSIYDQLCLGIRALDIRVQSKGDKLKMIHGFAKVFNTPNRFGAQMDMCDVLDSCYRFLDENKSECIIFQFKNDSNKEMEKCFDNLFYQYIKGNEKYWYLENRIPSLSEVRGRMVLVRRCKMDSANSDFNDKNTGIDFSAWVEQDWIAPNALVLKTNSADNAVFIVQDRYKYKPYPRWNECIKPFLNERTKFSSEYVICYLSTAGGLKGPKRNAEYINSQFMYYPLDREKYYGIIYLDFPFKHISEKIIKNNF